MPNPNLALSTRPSTYPTVVYSDDIVTLPINPTILDDVINELQDTLTDETITRGYLEQIVAEHQTECILGHDTLDFIEYIDTQTDGFLAGYTDSYAYLIVEKHEVWGGEAEWMPWDDNDEYLLTTAYTREVLEVGKSETADWAVDGIDVSTQAGYIVPVPFPLHSIAEEESITDDPLELAQKAEELADQTVIQPSVADCLVLLDSISHPRKEAIGIVSRLLGIGVSEIQVMIDEANQACVQARQTTDRLTNFSSID